MTEYEWDVSELDVLDGIRDLARSDRNAALATIVAVEGSAYRRPGAKMTVEQDGTGQGYITAGCIEDEVLELVETVLERGEATLETYDLMEDDDIWGLGLGCNGIIDVLVDPIDESYDPLARAVDRGEPIGVITVLAGNDRDGEALPTGARAYFRDGEIALIDDLPQWLLDGIAGPVAELLEAGKSQVVSIEQAEASAEVFIDGIQPPPRLVVLGSGPDVGPMIDLGKKNGFRVEVVGFRGGVELEEEFPGADEHRSTTPASLVDVIDPDGRTYVTVMTHNFVDDRIAVEELLNTDVPYIGLMGPRKRFEEMLAEFEQEGTTFDETELEPLYTPVGLNLGAGSPYGIATSVISEILAVHNDREPIHLKERDGPIHDRVSVDAAPTD